MFAFWFALALDGIPTSVDFVRDNLNQMVTSYNSAACILFDLETGQPVTRLETDKVKIYKPSLSCTVHLFFVL